MLSSQDSRPWLTVICFLYVRSLCVLRCRLGGCLVSCHSTSGYYAFLGDNLISWSSKRQGVISRSSAEAKYRGVANAVAETCWVHNLLREIGCPPTKTIIVYCDNINSVYMTSNPVQHQRAKHIEIDIHFVHDLVARGLVRVFTFCPQLSMPISLPNDFWLLFLMISRQFKHSKLSSWSNCGGC